MNGRNTKPSTNIFLAKNKYCWIYEYNMYKNPTIVFNILRIISFFDLLAWLIASTFKFESKGVIEALATTFIPFAYILIALVSLSIIAYYMYALIRGGRYCVIFQMNNEGIHHIRMKRKYQKSGFFMSIGNLLNAFTNDNFEHDVKKNPITDVDSDTYTNFSDVRKIIIYRRENAIKLISKKGKESMVYSERDDMEFIMNFITDHSSLRAKVSII